MNVQTSLRGSGLLLGIVCKEEAAPYIAQAEEAGLLLVAGHRKYIIAVALLLKSDFNYIKEYVKGEII